MRGGGEMMLRFSRADLSAFPSYESLLHMVTLRNWTISWQFGMSN